MGNNSDGLNWVFHAKATEVGNGSEIVIYANMVSGNIEISGDAQGTVVFEGKSVYGGEWYSILCENAVTGEIASQTNQINSLWKVDLSNLVNFRVRISEITAVGDESISIKARITNSIVNTNNPTLPMGASTEAKQDEIIDALKYSVEANVDTGTATGGSSTTLIDTNKYWADNIWDNALIEIDIDGTHYIKKVTSHTSDIITIPELPIGVEVVEGSKYWLKIPVEIQDIEKVGGIQQTGIDLGTAIPNLVQTSISTNANIGQIDDTEADNDGTVIAILKKIRTLVGNLVNGIKTLVTGTKVYEQDFVETYAAASSVNTVKTIELDLPNTSRSEYALIIKNESIVTDIVAYIFANEDDLGDILLTSITIPKTQSFNGVTIGGYVVLTHGMFVGVPSKIKLSNTSQDASAYDVTVRVREVG